MLDVQFREDQKEIDDVNRDDQAAYVVGEIGRTTFIHSIFEDNQVNQ